MRHSVICIPATPRGVTLFSIVVATHMSSGNGLKKSTLRQLFGREDATVVSCFGTSVLLTESMGIVEDGFELLCHAGLFGFYASAMTDAREQAWLSELRRKAFDGPNPQKFVTGMSQQRLVKRAMYCCQQCMREDEANYGIAFWRTVHQIPGIYHCPTHAEALLGACLGCGRSQGSDHEWNLPALSCPHCGIHKFSTVPRSFTSGYARHLSLVARVCAGDRQFLRPTARARLFEQAFGGDGNRSVQGIILQMLKMWECATLPELSALLGTKLTSHSLDQIFRNAYDSINPMALLAIVSVAESILAEKCFRDKKFSRPVVSMARSECPIAPAALEAALETAGLPARMATQLCSGLSLTRISTEEGIPYPRLRRQVTLVLQKYFEHLRMERSGDSMSQSGRKNLQRLADKLREPVRRMNKFRRQNSVEGFEALRALNRSKLERYLQQGIKTRKQLHYKNSDLGDWLRKFDSDWFDAVLPAIVQAMRKGVGRRRGSRNTSVWTA